MRMRRTMERDAKARLSFSGRPHFAFLSFSPNFSTFYHLRKNLAFSAGFEQKSLKAYYVQTTTFYHR